MSTPQLKGHRSRKFSTVIIFLIAKIGIFIEHGKFLRPKNIFNQKFHTNYLIFNKIEVNNFFSSGNVWYKNCFKLDRFKRLLNIIEFGTLIVLCAQKKFFVNCSQFSSRTSHFNFINNFPFHTHHFSSAPSILISGMLGVFLLR